MKRFPFDVPGKEEVVLVNVTIEDIYAYRLALDTAATNTTIDSNVLYLSGYELKNSKGEVEIETSNGIILAEIYELVRFECFDVVCENFEVQVYDFLALGITSNYDGVLGLDFLRRQKFCLDVIKGEITVD